MIPVFYDTHAHLDYPDFAADLEQVVQRATDAGITRLISIGTDFESSRRALALSDRFPQVYAAVGWHPSDVLQAPPDIRSELRTLAAHPKVVAIGETGLDYYRLPSKQPGVPEVDDEEYKRRQAQLFEQHLEIAIELGLNCVVHQREALEETLQLVAPSAGKVRCVFHCFANDVAAMQRIVAMGSLVSFTGILTFKNGQNIRDTLAATALGHFMLETDAPFLAPIPYRGKRCESAYVKEIAAVAAQVKGCSLEELSEATCATAHAFFSRLA